MLHPDSVLGKLRGLGAVVMGSGPLLGSGFTMGVIPAMLQIALPRLGVAC